MKMINENDKEMKVMKEKINKKCMLSERNLVLLNWRLIIK